MHSLHARLLLVATLVLAGFLGATGLVLERAFRDSAETAMQERLRSQLYTLLAAADEDADGRMLPPADLPEPRFSSPESGLYAVITPADGSERWQSVSLTGLAFEPAHALQPGNSRFGLQSLGERRLYTFAYGVAWEDYQQVEAFYTFTVAEDAAGVELEVDSFRATLWRWLGGMAIVLLLAQGFILRWGLKPLRRVTRDLQAVRDGRRARLEGRYPRELAGLTTSLNSLIEHGSAVQARYRNSLDDLAHSLKTPLAILQSGDATGSDDRVDATLIREQVQRMDDIISHQLQRAAVSGRATLARPVPVAAIVERLVRTLDKVYRDKQLTFSLDLDPDSRFIGDEADLTEILGNLLDNACKYGRQEVHVSTQPDAANSGLTICIEDDGPGIAADQVQAVLQRGARMDESVPGQGIGLSMAHEIIDLYGGQLAIDRGPLGGARLTLHFPHAASVQR